MPSNDPTAASHAEAAQPAPIVGVIVDKEIHRAVHLASVEIVAGSIGHGLKIPFTGHLLSLYQLNVLSNGLNKDNLPASSCVEISGVVSILKSLSPAGNKVGPMFSIMMQGFLFWLGSSILGAGLLGQMLGAILLSLWSFAQPLITYILIFGPDFFKMVHHYNSKMAQEFPVGRELLLIALTVLIAAKVCLGLFIVLKSYLGKAEWILKPNRFMNLLKARSKTVFKHPEDEQALLKASSLWMRVMRDLFNPLFIVSLILMFLFALNMGAKLSVAWLSSLRSVALGFLIFFLIRHPFTGRILQKWTEKSAVFAKFHRKALIVASLLRSQNQKNPDEKHELKGS